MSLSAGVSLTHTANELEDDDDHVISSGQHLVKSLTKKVSITFIFLFFYYCYCCCCFCYYLLFYFLNFYFYFYFTWWVTYTLMDVNASPNECARMVYIKQHLY